MADKKPSKILDFLYLGSKNTAKSKGLLKSLNIKYILNVTPPRSVDPNAGCPNFFEKNREFTYKRVAIFDNRGESVLAHLPGCIAFMDQGKHYGNVLVHCNKGVSRSTSMVLGYLMKRQGMSYDEALAYVKARRPEVQPNDAFEAQLRQYQARLEASKEQNSEEAKEKQKQHRALRQFHSDDIGPSGPPTAPCDSKMTDGFLQTIGPSIGPPMSQKTDSTKNADTLFPVKSIGVSIPTDQNKSQEIGPSPITKQEQKIQQIGPSMPPNYTNKSQEIGPYMPLNQKKFHEIGPSMPTHQNKKQKIGPSMPPNQKELQEIGPYISPSQNKAQKEITPSIPPNENRPQEIIGPSMPPHQGKAQQRIGPAMPPKPGQTSIDGSCMSSKSGACSKSSTSSDPKQDSSKRNIPLLQETGKAKGLQVDEAKTDPSQEKDCNVRAQKKMKIIN
mmetsp:Transcript_1010/g.1287  ORF Transcript_1010/g.1287 Transcript_1010/m.1287 type:complete len:445 (-) Transcript_1010:182-1516(-)|eukprot:CAMPEP_0117752808 /NCGR_PEP_ID=MMETSP0947-20121206/11843_1 /TAXON_ID=44440 /ORGANISM="Chattonella subsalsa, Strain CCMP2191" /LENGTH=444 /DNA_ID=CAMNT_0005571555 /DNA_START=48 /DNA_END=1382 /DNA_ORIENTATION=-